MNTEIIENGYRSIKALSVFRLIQQKNLLYCPVIRNNKFFLLTVFKTHLLIPFFFFLFFFSLRFWSKCGCSSHFFHCQMAEQAFEVQQGWFL